jgi:hypothetical protein
MLQKAIQQHDEEDDWQASQDAAKLLDTVRREVTPVRVGFAGVMIFLLFGVLFSSWYYVVPRDDVTVETRYMQRSGHLLMSQIHNDGSREITDVTLTISFETVDGIVLDSIQLSVDKISSHSSLAGDQLEMHVIGYSVWDEYTIHIELKWKDFDGERQQQQWNHQVGHWSQEMFFDQTDGKVWFIG